MPPGRRVLQHRGILHLPVHGRLLRRRLSLHPRYSPPHPCSISYTTGVPWDLSPPFRSGPHRNMIPLLLLSPPERTKTRCETHRESLLAVTEFGPRGPRPPVGQYIPTCDANGEYEPMQCHGSTGYCWCVERNGQEIPGSRSGPGSSPMCEEATGCLVLGGPRSSARPSVPSLIPGLCLCQVLNTAACLRPWDPRLDPTSTRCPRERTCSSPRAAGSSTCPLTVTL